VNRTLKPFVGIATALCLLIGVFSPLAFAAAASGESEAAFAQQLKAKQVQSVAINKYLRSMTVTLKDGTQVTTRYPKKESQQTATRLKADGVAVTFLAKKQAFKEAKKGKKHHHKIRYIVGGVLVLVIVIAGLVLLIRRRGSRD
jgi:ATP-dependent Zn protease